MFSALLVFTRNYYWFVLLASFPLSWHSLLNPLFFHSSLLCDFIMSQSKDDDSMALPSEKTTTFKHRWNLIDSESPNPINVEEVLLTCGFTKNDLKILYNVIEQWLKSCSHADFQGEYSLEELRVKDAFAPLVFLNYIINFMIFSRIEEMSHSVEAF